MPTKIVDLSARSEIIRDEPFHVHFWECTPSEYKKYLGDPRTFLEKMGIKIYEDALTEAKVDEKTKSLIRDTLLVRTREHVTALENLKK